MMAGGDTVQVEIVPVSDDQRAFAALAGVSRKILTVRSRDPNDPRGRWYVVEERSVPLLR